MGDVVGGTDHLGQIAVEDAVEVGIATAHQQELVGLLVFAQFENLVGHGVDGFVPGDGHELGVFSPPFFGVGAFHRGFDAIGIIKLLKQHVTTRADISTISFGKLIAADFDGATILNKDFDRAPGGTPLTGIGNPFASSFPSGFGRRTIHGAGGRFSDGATGE